MERQPEEKGKGHVVVEWVQQTTSNVPATGGVTTAGVTHYEPKYRNQYLASVAANLAAIAFGAALSWSATALPSLRADMTFEKLSVAQEAWIASFVALGAFLSGPICGPCVVRFGRKQTMLTLTLPFLLGWALIFFAANVKYLYVGRILCGFCGGALSLAAPMFIQEMASVRYRGLMTAMFGVMITVGQLFVFIVGAVLDWRYQALACGMIPLLFHICMWFVPESPTYLVHQGRREEALRSLKWFRGAPEQRFIEEELNQLNRQLDITHARNTTHHRTWRDLFGVPLIKPMSVILLLFIFQELSAINALMFYTVDIFKATGIRLWSYYAAIIIGVVQMLAAIFSSAIVHRCGRRPLLLGSEFFMTAGMGCMGLFFYYQKNKPQSAADYLEWLPLTAMIMFVLAYSVGMGPISYLILGERLPFPIRGTASSIVTTVKWALGFTIVFLFEDVLVWLGRDGAFWLYGGLCLLGFVFILICVPEYEGTLLEESRFISDVDIGKGPENEPFSTSPTRTYGLH